MSMAAHALVREQYEAYPYPPRDPAEEDARLLETMGDFLDYANHDCFGGAQDFGKGFRVLVAGGGTGDGLIFLAEQLRDTGAEIVYLDVSAASLDISRKRAKNRGLKNISWINNSLLSLPELGLGEFDYINCSGVLHHLQDPAAGLSSLAASLKDHGALCVMVYAPYGRAGIYQAQQLLRMLVGADDEPASRVAEARRVIECLTPEHVFRLVAPRFAEDLERMGDAGFYDLLLHSCDRAFSVPDIYEWIEDAGLHLISFEPYGGGRLRYNPAYYLRDPALVERARRLPLREQHAAAELLAGSIAKHCFYAGKRPVTALAPDNADLVPFIPACLFGERIYEDIRRAMEGAAGGQVLEFRHAATNATMKFQPSPLGNLLFRYLDGQRSVGEVMQACLADPLLPAGTSRQVLLESWLALYERFAPMGWMLLRTKTARAMPSTAVLQERMRRATAGR